MLLNNLFGLVLGLLTGLATGFFFERRATKEARAQSAAALQSNEELRRYIAELEAHQRENQDALQQTVRKVQQTVYSSAAPTGSIPTPIPTLDPERVKAEIRSRLNASGQASLPVVTKTFISHGHTMSAIDSVLHELHSAGEINIDGKAVELA